MKRPRNNPLFLIIICMVMLMLSQTLTAFAVVFIHGGNLFQQDIE